MSKNNSGPSFVGKHNKKKTKDINSQIIEKFQIKIPQKLPKIGRNNICNCGSNLKYKKCCLIKNI